MSGPLHGPLERFFAEQSAPYLRLYVDSRAEEARFFASRRWAGGWAHWTITGIWAEEALRRREMGT